MLTVGHQCDAEVIKLMLKVAEPIVKVFSVQSNSFSGKKNPMSLLINSRLLFSVLVLQTNDIAETDPFCREKKSDKNLLWKFLVARYATLHPVMSVRRSVPFLLFLCFWAFWEYGSCPDALVTFSSTAPAHPHAIICYFENVGYGTTVIQADFL